MNPARARAESKITVRSSEAKPYETASPKLLEIRITEKFSGDIDGESHVRALQVQRDDKSACVVSLQRFTGNLADAKVPSSSKARKPSRTAKIKATWFVIAGSGTGDLSGLRGEGWFEGDIGKGSDGWLDYWFE